MLVNGLNVYFQIKDGRLYGSAKYGGVTSVRLNVVSVYNQNGLSDDHVIKRDLVTFKKCDVGEGLKRRYMPRSL